MADTTIALPYTATTSGDQLDASSVVVGAATVKRERMVIGNDTSSHVAVVTTSGALSVTRSTAVSLSSAPTIDSITNTVFTVLSVASGVGLVPGTSSHGLVVQSTQPISISSGIISLSSVIGISSGLVTLSSNPVASQIVSLSSGTVTLSSNPTVVSASSGLVQISGTPTIVSASSGFVQVYQSTSPWLAALSSGTVTMTNPSTAVNLLGSTGTLAIVTSGGSQTVSVVSSGGIFAPVTSSAGLIVTLATGAGSGGAGSTAINLPTVSAAGFAPVTSSYGLVISHRSTGRTLGTLNTTLGAPVTQILTTAAIWVYSLTIVSTVAGTVGNAVNFYTATSALSSNVPVAFMTNVTAAPLIQQNLYPNGVLFNTGLSVAVALTFGTTGTNTFGPAKFNIEYEI